MGLVRPVHYLPGWQPRSRGSGLDLRVRSSWSRLRATLCSGNCASWEPRKPGPLEWVPPGAVDHANIQEHRRTGPERLECESQPDPRPSRRSGLTPRKTWSSAATPASPPRRSSGSTLICSIGCVVLGCAGTRCGPELLPGAARSGIARGPVPSRPVIPGLARPTSGGPVPGSRPGPGVGKRRAGQVRRSNHLAGSSGHNRCHPRDAIDLQVTDAVERPVGRPPQLEAAVDGALALNLRSAPWPG